MIKNATLDPNFLDTVGLMHRNAQSLFTGVRTNQQQQLQKPQFLNQLLVESKLFLLVFNYGKLHEATVAALFLPA